MLELLGAQGARATFFVIGNQIDYRPGDIAREAREGHVVGNHSWTHPDFTTLTRQTTLAQSTDRPDEITRVAIDLMRAVRKPGQPVRLIGVGVSSLGTPARQLSLWDTPSEKAQQLDEAIEQLRQRFGKDVIRHGS